MYSNYSKNPTVIFLVHINVARRSSFLPEVDRRRLATTDTEKYLTSRFFTWRLHLSFRWSTRRSGAMPHKLNALNGNFLAWVTYILVANRLLLWLLR